MRAGNRIYVAGHAGLVGRALVRALDARGYGRVMTVGRGEVDLAHRDQVDRYFREERPEYVLLAAAKVGGIWANDQFPADFLRENLAIELNVIDAARRWGVKKLLFLGSSCIYPRDADQPLRETALLRGPLESTNEGYAIAKIAGIKLCQAYQRQYGSRFVSVMPTNLYGPFDNFDPQTSHVLPALIRKFHEAVQGKEDHVVVWGTGAPRREFLHVDDLAEACLFLMHEYESSEIINVGWGKDVTILELASMLRDISGFEGEIRFDPSRPDGTPRKVLDVSRIQALGWTPKIGLREGLRATFDWYVSHVGQEVGPR